MTFESISTLKLVKILWSVKTLQTEDISNLYRRSNMSKNSILSTCSYLSSYSSLSRNSTMSRNRTVLWSVQLQSTIFHCHLPISNCLLSIVYCQLLIAYYQRPNDQITSQFHLNSNMSLTPNFSIFVDNCRTSSYYEYLDYVKL